MNEFGKEWSFYECMHGWSLRFQQDSF
jgi:hypothetical protein